MSRQAKRYAKRDPQWQARSLLRTTLSMFPGAVPELLSTPLPSERPWLRIIGLERERLDELRIDAEGLCRVRRALKQFVSFELAVLRRFSRDPSAWVHHVQAISDLISRRLHGQQLHFRHLSNLCPQRMRDSAEAIVSEFPELEPLLSLVLQVELTRREGIDETRWKFFQIHTESMRRIVAAEDDLRLHLGIYQIGPSIHPGWFRFLIDALCCPELSDSVDACLPRLSELTKKFRKRLRFDAAVDKLPRPKLRGELITHTRWLVRQTTKRISAVTHLLGVLVDDSTIKDVRDSLAGVADATRDVVRAHAKATSLGPKQYIHEVGRSDSIERILERPSKLASITDSLVLLRKHVRSLMKEDLDAKQLNGPIRFFEVIPEGDWQARLQWHQVLQRALPQYNEDCRGRNRQLLRSLGALFARHGMPSGRNDPRSREGLMESMARYSRIGEKRENYIAVVERVFYKPPTIAFHPDTVSAAAMNAESAAEAVQLVEEHARRGNSVTNLYQMEYARKLATSVGETFDLLRWFAEAGLCRDELELLLQINDPVLLRSIRKMLECGQKKRLERLVTHLRLAQATEQTLPEVPTFGHDSAWVHSYPEPLWDALLEFNERCENASAIIAKVLRQNFPQADCLGRQIETLQQRLRDPSLGPAQRERMASKVIRLRCYLNQPPLPSKDRLKNLAAKIRARCETWVLEQLETSCRQESLRSLVGERATSSLPSRLSQSPYNELLPAVLSLRGWSRRIGLRLLLAGDDERKNLAPLEPANARFLGKMRRLGIAMEPWLDANQSESNQFGDHQLRFEDDALELLLMGHHFSTCLSPHDMNFFSAVSNSIDINKQVLYCRNKDGKVVGRCLFALTDAGLIMTFCRYSHQTHLPFDEMVDAFAEDLAQRMGTGLTSSGHVSSLVSNDWYDDGPVPGGLARFFDGDRPLSTLLSETKESNLSKNLCEFFGAKASVVANLGLVLDQIESASRKDLIVPFIRLMASEKLAFAQRMPLAVRAHQCGATSLAQALIANDCDSRLPQRLKRFVQEPCGMSVCDVERGVVGILLQTDLRLAHRYLITTRPRNVRRDEDESSFRRESLAEIHRRRGRIQLAQRLSQQAI